MFDKKKVKNSTFGINMARHFTPVRKKKDETYYRVHHVHVIRYCTVCVCVTTFFWYQNELGNEISFSAVSDPRHCHQKFITLPYLQFKSTSKLYLSKKKEKPSWRNFRERTKQSSDVELHHVPFFVIKKRTPQYFFA